MSNNPDGDSIEAHVGKDNKGIAVGKDIQQDIQENHAENIFNISLPKNEGKQRPQRAKRKVESGVLMADAAQEIWKTIAEMRETMGGFRQAVDMNSQATREQAISVKELAKVVDMSNQRNESAIQKMGEQVMALNRVAQAIKSMGIQVPDGHPELLVSARQPPWWKEWLTPILLTVLIMLVIFFMATGGHIP